MFAQTCLDGLLVGGRRVAAADEAACVHDEQEQQEDEEEDGHGGPEEDRLQVVRVVRVELRRVGHAEPHVEVRQHVEALDYVRAVLGQVDVHFLSFFYDFGDSVCGLMTVQLLDFVHYILEMAFCWCCFSNVNLNGIDIC